MKKKTKEGPKKSFSRFFKKSFACLALAGVMVASPMVLAGCSAGKDGEKGADGATWLSGTITPTNAVGKVGDFYYDVDDYNIYKKGEYGWELVSNIKGPQGDAGSGSQGSATSWLTGTVIVGTGTSIPATIAGAKVGDLYFNTNTCDIYKCTTTNIWSWISNTKGPQGPTGSTGPQGSVGLPGTDGATWITGDIVPADTTGNDGDMYLNTTTCDLYQKIDGSWGEPICNIKGAQGETGPEGPQGDVGPEGPSGGPAGPAGAPGVSAYVGYDGYIWNGEEKTQFKTVDVTLGENVVENTIGVEGTMSMYFEGSYIDLSENTLALMYHFKPNAQLTAYGNTTVTEIKVVAETAGELQIGIAKVADIIEARTNGTTYTATTTAYNVEPGLNTIEVSLVVGEDETIVLGGQGSVGLYVAKGIPAEDEAGNFTLLDNTAHDDIVCETGDIQDTLAIQVSATVESIRYVDLTTSRSAIESAEKQTAAVSTYGISNPASAPWMYSNSKNAFAGKALVSIRIPVVSVDTISEKPVFTLRIAKYNTTGTIITAENVRETIKLEIPLSEVEEGVYDSTSAAGSQSTRGEYVVNKWIKLDLTKYNIVVKEGETIVFGDTSDTVRLAYSTTNIADLNFYSVKGVPSTGSTSNNLGYLADVGVADCKEEASFEVHLEKLNQKEEQATLI